MLIFVLSFVDKEGDDAFICWYWNSMQWVLFDSFLSPGNIYHEEKKSYSFQSLAIQMLQFMRNKIYHLTLEDSTKLHSPKNKKYLPNHAFLELLYHVSYAFFHVKKKVMLSLTAGRIDHTWISGILP